MRRTLLLFLILALPAPAQTTGEISGLVLDVHGQPLAGARVTVTNQLTRSESDYWTQADGSYAATKLDPQALYTAEASHGGFASAVHPNLVVGATSKVDFVLEPKTGFPMPAAGTLTYLILGAFIASVVGGMVLIFVTEPGRKLFAKIGEAFGWLGNKAYEILAPRFPKMVGLKGYRKRIQRSELARIEHPVGPGDLSLSLERAFAPLAVMTGEGEDRVELYPFAEAHRRFLILGGPGTGKTTLMKSLIMSVLQKRTHTDLDGLIPVFVVLREMSASGHTVEQALVAAMAKFRFKNAEQFIHSALEGGRLLIILDGLDEVGANRSGVSGQIRSFCDADDQRDNPNRLVVTCRENSYRVKDLADVIASVTRMEPFSPQHMRTFLQGWPMYKGRVALQLYPQIQADAQILDICRNPLLLTLLAGLYLAKDKFDLPSSREAFYETAIDELLVQRPARKQQAQSYSATHKWQMLQRIALDRLETVGIGDDPELMRRERLLEYARQVLGAELKEADFQTLLNELDMVNSIIKPVYDGGYVFGHRTFQEYLAAREANRTRQKDQVIARFSGRAELAEVLCFYCGLVKNIPTLDQILSTVLNDGDPLLAARCLLNVAETPAEAVVTAIVDALYQRIEKQKTFAVELDSLASLARRPANQFEVARQRFSSAVEEILKSSGAGSAGLISALSANPSLSMSLIPGLLRHPDEAWRRQAVELLHNLGTESALQELVQVAVSGGNPERELACVQVANLIESRNREIRGMVDLFPERAPDLVAWPFESQFPGRIALALMDGIDSSREVVRGVGLQNKCMMTALTMRTTSSTWLRRHMWRHVGLHIRLNEYLVRGWTAIRKIGPPIVVTLALLLGGLQCMDSLRLRTTLIEFWPPRLVVSSAAPYDRLSRAATQMSAEISKQYPPRAKGMARLLPWNWVTQPGVPKDTKGVIDTLRLLSCAGTCTWPLRSEWDALPQQLASLQVSPVVSNELLIASRTASVAFPPPNWHSIYIVGSRETREIFLVGAFLIVAVGSGYTLMTANRSRPRGQPSRALWMIGGYTVAASAVILQITLRVPVRGTWQILLQVLLWSAFGLAIALEQIVRRGSVRFVPNPYMGLVGYLRPLSGEGQFIEERSLAEMLEGLDGKEAVLDSE